MLELGSSDDLFSANERLREFYHAGVFAGMEEFDRSMLIDRITDKPAAVAAISNLSDPRVYFVNSNHRLLVVGDGCDFTLEETRGVDFYTALRDSQMYFVTDEGGRVVVDPNAARMSNYSHRVTEMGMMRDWEYEMANASGLVNDALGDDQDMTWLCGYMPGGGDYSRVGFRNKGDFFVQDWPADLPNPAIGVRRVVRVPLLIPR